MYASGGVVVVHYECYASRRVGVWGEYYFEVSFGYYYACGAYAPAEAVGEYGAAYYY